MGFEQTWRWFGPNDPISLQEIRQTGATGIVTALHHIPAGNVWSPEEILARKRIVEAAGMTWSVAESLPVHDDIKKRRGGYRKLLEQYKDSLRNLGACGVDTVCYNFMPVLDWSRTDLEVVFNDGSITTKFDARVFAAFDLFLLKRPDAERDYTDEQVRSARHYAESLDGEARERLVRTVLLGFPGSGERYTLEGLRQALAGYKGLGDAELREHLYEFVREIAPVAEEAGVFLVIHPDDPPWPLLGLPRVLSGRDDVDSLLRAADSVSNGLTLCTGSFGAAFNNDLVELAERFASRINFVHLRNVQRAPNGDFLEENHLDGDIDIYGVMKALLLEQKRRVEQGRKDFRMPMRPDHGHLMIPDRQRQDVYPGYSLFGRMRGLAELRGLEMGILRSLGL